ncbi:DNA-3-methyladenine glycosylase family protein [Methanosphaerula palustris]|uniref:DNA-(apurinic or apyrimidinic site) lyase n=1 Tax=Methanosphaerula palustris (strain ATCC BAA-1556 / DSM 19958 / E1-9c) TaxID=521011 RepID=B8GEV8_METPE|nr:DNA glycosylase [Methanosphaerula palustris]ACL15925.1 8-oxoguanine DNA glycosylase domain protein [Methanosphaerula palustris E1-9c]
MAHTLNLSSDQSFSLSLTLGCGQAFRWEQDEAGWWEGVVGDEVIRVRQEDRSLTFTGTSEERLIEYFALDMDLAHVLETIDRDPFIHAAIEECAGLRILRQPSWECLLSYLCATNTNIPMVKKRVRLLAESLGERIPGTDQFAFPVPSVFNETCAEPLDHCRLGYRKGYLATTACQLAAEGGWEGRVRAQPFEEARQVLTRLPGIGPKAADCVLLFGFSRYEAFPVDVWIRRIMQQFYPETAAEGSFTPKEYERIRRFAWEYFGEYAGYAQEYLYGARMGAAQIP